MKTQVSVWDAKRNTYVVESKVQPQTFHPCLDGDIAYQAFPPERWAHANDYFIGWISPQGVARDIRRWPKAARPSPSPHLNVVGCGICGGPALEQAPRIVLLGCTSLTAWVRVGDTVKRVTIDNHVESFSLMIQSHTG